MAKEDSVVKEVVQKPEQVKPVVDAPAAPKQPKMVFVRTVRGELRHLFTNTLFTSDPKKVEVDGFLQAQIDAGKLEVVQP